MTTATEIARRMTQFPP